MLATGRYSLSLSEDEFWRMSPGMWNEMNLARLREIQITDAMQARISMMIAATIPMKNGKKPKESEYRMFADAKPKKLSLLDKFKMMAATVNSRLE